MAKKIFLKVWSVLISSLALLGADVSSQSRASSAASTPGFWELPLKRSNKPNLFLQQKSNSESDMLIAAHRSHSSHRSHASHASHVSGVGNRATPTESTIKSTDANETKKAPAPAKSITPANRSDKGVFLTNGVAIACDSSWLSEGKVHCLQNGKTFSLPLEDVDLQKTSLGTGK